MRVHDKLWTDVKRSADSAKRSLSDEVAFRLNSALNEESALGGPELRSMAQFMVSRFNYAGQREAEWILGPGTPAGVWLKDIRCYDAAFLSLVEALLLKRPDPSLDEVAKFLFERLQTRIDAHYRNKELRKKEAVS